MILKDLDDINMKMKFEDIKKMDKKLFMNIIKRKIEYKALNDLNRGAVQISRDRAGGEGGYPKISLSITRGQGGGGQIIN